jgi:hypothetical protein
MRHHLALSRIIHSNNISKKMLETAQSDGIKGRDRTGSKTVINNKIIEQVNTFNYLVNLMSYEKEKDNKITIFKDNKNNQ